MKTKKLCRICGENERRPFRLDCKECIDYNTKNGRQGVDFYLNRPHDVFRNYPSRDTFNGFY